MTETSNKSHSSFGVLTLFFLLTDAHVGVTGRSARKSGVTYVRRFF